VSLSTKDHYAKNGKTAKFKIRLHFSDLQFFGENVYKLIRGTRIRRTYTLSAPWKGAGGEEKGREGSEYHCVSLENTH